jgi:very-short-patch-repair endonuclease
VTRVAYIASHADQLLPILADAVFPALLGLILLAVALRFRRPTLFYRSILNHLRARPIMSEPERQLFRKLHIALGSQYSICPQLAFSAFITDSGKLRGRFRWKVRALFNTKRADFGIYDWHKNRVVALVELDDSTHRGREDTDAKRDAIALAAGIRTYRLRAGDDTSPQAIAEIFHGLYTAKP